MYTVVQGKKIPMAPGDVLLTPNWAWHGHANESGKAAYWIDFLDAPLVQLLEPMFFEHFPDGVEKPSGVDENSPMRFPVVETMTRLDEVEARHHNDDDAPLEIELGKPALDTIGLFVRRLRAGTKTKPIQTTANNIFGVIDGTGETDVDGEIIKWKRGDVFVAPAWRAFSHTADGKAHILRVTDEPVLTRLNLLHGH
jgi:gentisate 1,2-dioxygenase